MAMTTFDRVPDFVPLSLRYAYLATEIFIDIDGQPFPIAQLRDLERGPAFVLTAHNPRSRQLSDAENRDRNEALAQELAENGHHVERADAFDLHTDWHEASFVVRGLNHRAARRLCRAYEQFAYFEVTADVLIVHGGFSRWSLSRPHGLDPLPVNDRSFRETVRHATERDINNDLKRFRRRGWTYAAPSEERCRECDDELDLYALTHREKAGRVVEHLAVCCPSCGWHAAGTQLGRDQLRLLELWFDYRIALSDSGGAVAERRCYVVEVELPRGPAVYVGETGKSPEERFREHKEGHKANRDVREHGVGLNRDLMAGLPTFPDVMTSRTYEVYLGKKLQRAGYTVLVAH